MRVTMSVYQIRAQKQGVVVQNLRRRACGDGASALKDMAMVGDILDQVEVMSSRDHCLASAATAVPGAGPGRGPRPAAPPGGGSPRPTPPPPPQPPQPPLPFPLSPPPL